MRGEAECEEAWRSAGEVAGADCRGSTAGVLQQHWTRFQPLMPPRPRRSATTCRPALRHNNNNNTTSPQSGVPHWLDLHRPAPLLVGWRSATGDRKEGTRARSATAKHLCDCLSKRQTVCLSVCVTVCLSATAAATGKAGGGRTEASTDLI